MIGSFNQIVDELDTKSSVATQLKCLIRNPNFIFVMVGASLVISSTFLFPIMLDEMVQPYNYNSSSVSTQGVALNGFGLLGGIAIALYL